MASCQVAEWPIVPSGPSRRAVRRTCFNFRIGNRKLNVDAEVLPDHADLLCEFAAARGVCVHDDRVRRDRALQADVRVHVAYLTGTDEHGVNIERAAEKLGITPQELVDRNEKIFRELWKLLGITNTDFIRTTEPRARARGAEAGAPDAEASRRDAIYKAKYEGRYCIYDNLYVSDTPEPADCQICGRPGELDLRGKLFFPAFGVPGKAA